MGDGVEKLERIDVIKAVNFCKVLGMQGYEVAAARNLLLGTMHFGGFNGRGAKVV
jgi:hypothetical protein